MKKNKIKRMQRARDFYSFISSKEVQARSRKESEDNTINGTREASNEDIADAIKNPPEQVME